MDRGYRQRFAGGTGAAGLRACPEQRQEGRRWTDKPVAQEKAFRANRRRVRGKGRRLNVAERTVRTNLCPCTDRRRSASVAGTDQCQQNTHRSNARRIIWVCCCARFGMRKPRNRDEGAWGGLWASLAWDDLATVIVFGIKTWSLAQHRNIIERMLTAPLWPLVRSGTADPIANPNLLGC